ncbi:MAG: flagellar hook-basal body complex protein FliE [Steroidobacter sp.]
MSIAAVASMSAIPQSFGATASDVADLSTQAPGIAGAKNTVFDKLLEHIEGVNTQLINTDNAVQQLANGGTDNLHQVMISLEQTRLAFDLLLQVRNKVLDAYQEVMRMQV